MTDGTGTSAGPATSTEPPGSSGGSAEGSGTGTPECTANDDAACDDDDPCTADECFDGACMHYAAEDFTPCTDDAGAAGLCRDGECVVDCEADAECDDQNPCTVDTCDLSRGLCVRDPLNNVEADASAQTAGDCSVVECDNGQPVDVPDPDDLPDDGNDCTTDTCRGGSPVFEPVGSGEACDGDGFCDGAGECVECLAPEDCDHLPPDDDCQQRTCVNNLCGQVFAELGTPLNAALQDNGDCGLRVCDGSGDWIEIDDPDDPFVDGLECTQDLCNSGVPQNPPLPEGTECAAGVCNAAGGCVGCIFPSDCGGTNTFCQTITCIANTCGVSNTAAGVPLPVMMQTANDCQQLQCDGDGMTQSVPDDGDVPVDDGNQCTSEACSNGVQLHPNRPVDTACNQDGGLFCDGAGTCVECNAAAQCSNADQCEVDACIDHTCAPQPEVAGVACDDGLFCTQTDTCDGAGACTGTGDPCPGPDGDANCSESCNEATNSCTANDPSGSACEDGQFCTSNDVCNAGTCMGGANPCPGPDGDGNCAESCDEGADNCLAPDPQGSACTDGLFCTANDQCNAAGACVGGANPCSGADGDGNCAESCDEAADACTAADPDGSACNDGLFCTQTDTCTAGVCVGTGDPCPGPDGDGQCNESCDEAADSCTAPDPIGVPCNDGLFCTLVDACNGGGVCEGVGSPCPGPDNDGNCAESCNEAADNCTANDPVSSVCDDGIFCNGADTCNGAGACSVHAGDPCPGPDGDDDCRESCNEATATCNAFDPVDSPCDDGLFCNGTDWCGMMGGCGQHSGNPCDGPDGDSDCSEVCNETLDDCSGNDPAGSPCNDGQFCNGADTCNGAGSCSVHAGDPCPGADNDCDCSETCREDVDDCNGNDPNGSQCGIGLCSSGSCIGICN